jgi:D-3-phosphoglycerate dehydrogenase
MKPRVVYYEVLSYRPENIKLLEEEFDLVRLNSPDDDTPELLASLDGILAPLKYYWGKEKLDLCKKLRAIASNTGGAPHIDTEYAATKGIKVLHLQNEFEKMKITPTPELTWALIIAVTRRIPWAHKAVIGGKWNRNDWVGQKMLSQMELGIVGIGRVGERVAKYGTGFGMTVRFYDPYVKKSPVEGVQQLESLEELVANSDIVSLHVMLSSQNQKLINGEILAKFRRGAYLVNTARGPLLDSGALIEALNSGRLAGAALDVIPEEFDHDFNGDVSNHPLIRYANTHDNLLITPHIAGSTVDAWSLCQERAIRMLIEAL